MNVSVVSEDAQPVPQSSASVLVDRSGRLGVLSYLVPARLRLSPGDAVLLPFGRSQREGLVVEVSDGPDPKATREVISRLGRRASPADVRVMLSLADRHMCDPVLLLGLLAPPSDRDAPPRDAGPVALSVPLLPPASVAREWQRRAVLAPPALPLEQVAASEVVRLRGEGSGQVLVVCPTHASVSRVLACFSSGAAELGSRSAAGTWTAWRRGLLPVAVGARSAAFFSARDLAGVVVVDDSHPGHSPLRAPYVSAVEVASERARQLQVPLSVVSRVHSPELLGAKVKVVLQGGSGRLWPSVRLLDRSRRAPSERGPEVFDGELRRAASSGREVVVLAERRTSVRVCVRCGSARPCGSCDRSGCGHRPAPCGRCGAPSVRWVGWDASRCASAFPSATVVGLSQLSELSPASRLVVVPDVDALSRSASGSQLLDASRVLLEAAAAAGAGRLVVGTSDPAWAPLRLLSSRDLVGFDRAVFDAAAAASQPPFVTSFLLRFESDRRPRLPAGLPGRVRGPVRGRSGWEVEVLASAEDLAEVRRLLAPLVARRGVRLTVR